MAGIFRLVVPALSAGKDDAHAHAGSVFEALHGVF
jgi:hypothetical protein